ncbi:MAG: M23 family metallopeptidase [Microscillaceae bacterium]|nr:M23 family metallopeptidase [Microscillaceae bacterium]
MSKFITTLILCLCASLAFAQVENPKKFENGKTITVPAQKKDTLKLVNPGKQKPDTTAKKTLPKSNPTNQDKEGLSDIGSFNPFKASTIVTRDTLAKGLNELKVVKITEELKVDCVWVKAAEYYSVWDSKNVNPYGRDASKFKDTLHFTLYNYATGELWSAPMDVTLQTSGFGYRWGRFHHGIDLNLQIGTPIYSVFDGIVRISGFHGYGYGNYIVVRHRNGLETLYAHLSTRKVEVGQVVKAGQLIGLGGSTGWSTGPHLHFEVRYAGNTFNPTLMYDFSKDEQLITDKFTLMPQHFSHLGNLVRQKVTHRVAEGETLSIISAKYNVPVYTLAKMNQITINAVLKVGQVLVIR